MLYCDGWTSVRSKILFFCCWFSQHFFSSVHCSIASIYVLHVWFDLFFLPYFHLILRFGIFICLGFWIDVCVLSNVYAFWICFVIVIIIVIVGCGRMRVEKNINMHTHTYRWIFMSGNILQHFSLRSISRDRHFEVDIAIRESIMREYRLYYRNTIQAFMIFTHFSIIIALNRMQFIIHYFKFCANAQAHNSVWLHSLDSNHYLDAFHAVSNQHTFSDHLLDIAIWFLRFVKWTQTKRLSFEKWNLSKEKLKLFLKYVQHWE